MEDRTALIDELEYRHQIQKQKNIIHKLVFFIAFSMFITGLFFILIPEFFVAYFQNERYNDRFESHVNFAISIKAWGGFLTVFSTVFFSYLYMVGFNLIKIREQAKNSKDSSFNNINNETIEIVGLLKSIDSSLEKGKLESALSEHERKEVIESISTTVEAHLNESLLGKIEQKYGSTIHSNKLSELSMRSLNKTVSRLSEYVSDLKNKAVVNLTYGIGSTVFAIAVLIYVLIQGISIFFLNLYRSTINNILYLSNEITNHEAKRDSLSIALSSGNLDSASSMLISLSQTERNFTLKKGETSIYDKGSPHLQAPLSDSLITELLNKINSKQAGSA